MGFDDRKVSFLTMATNRSDLALFGLTVVALGIGMFAFFKNQTPSSQLDLKLELQIIAVIRETDCVECVRNVICSWADISSDFQTQGVHAKIIFEKESDDFQKNELAFLCPLPGNMEILSFPKMSGSPWMPLTTPAVLVTNGKNTLHLEPIFLQTDMVQVHQRIASSINLFLPKASE